MSARERFKSLKGQAKERFRGVFGSSTAQSTRSLPSVTSPAVSPAHQSSATSAASDPSLTSIATISAPLAPTVAASSTPSTAAAPAAAKHAGSTSTISAAPNSASGPVLASPNVEPAGDKVKDTWVGLGRFRQVLTSASNLFGPLNLKLVIDDLAESIAVYEDAAMVKHEYQVLKTELERLFSTLSAHFASDVPPTITESMDSLCSAIKNELDQISTKEERGTGRRLWEANRDLDEVIACYRRIQGHLDRLTLNADLSTWKIVDEQATEARLNKLNPSMSASYNSREAAQVRRRECTPNTRKEVLSELSGWRHDQGQGNIYWLNGMAGTGKTTIATSLCKMLERNHGLGASFFCSRQLPECRGVNLILPTIAYQLACFSRPFRSALSRALARDPNIHTKELPVQLEGLIIGPLREVAHTLPPDPVVVIDALDECEDGDSVGEILGLLVKRATDLPIKVFVSSRPEEQIRKRIGSMKSQLVLHGLDEKIVQGDIEIYLQAELEGISVSESQMANLVKRAGVLFIYAATAVRYIRAKNSHFGQQERLNHVLNVSSTASSSKNKEIDMLYSLALTSAFGRPDLEESDIARMRLVLHTVVCAQEPLTVNALAGLLQLGDDGPVFDALESMWSVLHVSESGASSLVSTLHASFPDYMIDRTRSKEHGFDAQSHHGHLVELCLARIENNERQFNICELASSYVVDERVPNLSEKVKQAIPSDLEYACHYWAVHLELGGPSNGRVSLLDRFLSTRLLLWMEVLNLGKRMNVGPPLLEKAKKWCTNQNVASNTEDLVHDAWRFTTTFAANPVSRSTPHIYVSMLACWPGSRPIAEYYSRRSSRLVRVTGTLMGRRELALLGVIPTAAAVTSVAFSPDGMRIVSASRDCRMQVWDVQSGQLAVGPLEGHTGPVNTAMFSPDSTRIVSGSSDNTIRVWDAQSGQMMLLLRQWFAQSVNSVAFSPAGMHIASGCGDGTIRVRDVMSGRMVLGPLKGHTGWVNSVAFSPDGNYIVSGSSDRTIRVWGAQTGQIVAGPLEGHTSRVNTVAFSPDGMHIISGTGDNAIGLWSVETGQMVIFWKHAHSLAVSSVAFSPDGKYMVSGSWDTTIQVRDVQSYKVVLGIQGHLVSVNSVAFSPNGMRIVSGSMDGTIRVWDAENREVGQGPLQGHTSVINTVAFSPDGMHIVSGSGDKTIRVWDAQTGKMVLGPLKGHTNVVNAVVFSPDGMRIVSGSRDTTIIIWDVRTGQMVLEPLDGHIQSVNSVAFSHDGMRIVSGSRDVTICVWDAQTGRVALGPLVGHTQSVNSVAFSPNSMHIVSGSDDKTIRIWDSQTGELVSAPLQGHTESVNSVAFSPDGTRIVSGYIDGTVRIWDVQSGQMVLLMRHARWQSVNSVEFSPDGRNIVSGSSDNTIQVWDVQTGQMVREPLMVHTRPVNSVAFSPDGMRIVAGSRDHSISVWGVPNLSTTMSPMTQTPSAPQIHSTTPTPSAPSSWRLNPDGWAIDTQEHILLWVPYDLRDHFPVSPDLLIISPRGTAQLHFDHPAIGESWTECYLPAGL